MSASTTSTSSISNPLLPPNSLILVTGANGLIASHAADQLQAFGYRVRGTVRSASRAAYLTTLFTSRHGPNRFELFEMPHLSSSPSDWKDAVCGVSGIAHVLSALDMAVQDPDEAVAAELPWQIALLEAATAEEGVKSFVWTSSAWAAATPDASKKRRLTTESWNDEAVALARDKNVDAKSKGLAGYMAQKTLVEQRVWEWVREKKPRFAFNTLLYGTVLGECLDPANQGIPSTAGMAQWVWEGVHLDMLDNMQPQWFVNCRDAGRLYVALLVTAPVVDRERVYGFGGRYSWFRVAEILRELYPDHADKVGKMKDLGWDQTEVPNERGRELLERLGQIGGWRGLEESVRENAESWLKLDKAGVTHDKYSQIGK